MNRSVTQDRPDDRVGTTGPGIVPLTTEEMLALNRVSWDERAIPHATSPGYDIERLLADPTAVSDVVRFDLPRLGDVAGARGVHLQCHIGTDTLSLARLGASMTGLDFSRASVEQARDIAARANADVPFVEADVDHALDVLPAGGFDLVYTGIGALCWLPDVRSWAGVVAGLLAPGGRVFLREGHPVLRSLADPRPDGLVVVEYPYLAGAPTVFDEPGTYVDTEHEFVHTRTANWSHGLGEIITALLDAGLVLTQFVEHDSVPWNALPGQMTRLPHGEYRLTDRPERVPHTYTVEAVKPAMS